MHSHDRANRADTRGHDRLHRGTVLHTGKSRAICVASLSLPCKPLSSLGLLESGAGCVRAGLCRNCGWQHRMLWLMRGIHDFLTDDPSQYSDPEAARMGSGPATGDA
jgi:hypothetical protein